MFHYGWVYDRAESESKSSRLEGDIARFVREDQDTLHRRRLLVPLHVLARLDRTALTLQQQLGHVTSLMKVVIQ